MIGLWIGKTGEANAWYHITLTACPKACDFLHVVRHRPPVREVDCTYIQYHTFKPGKGIKSFLKLFFLGWKVLKNNKIDFIITFNVFPYGLISYLLALLFDKKLVLAFIGADFNTYFLKKYLSRRLISLALKKSSVIVCKGKHMTKELVDHGVPEEKLFYYPHFVCNEMFEVPESSHYDYEIINISELIKRKRVNILLEALRILKEKGILLRTCIVGDGPELEFLKKKACEYDIQSLVAFVGFQKDVKSYLKRSKIYVQSSAGEGLSLSLLEAYCSGLVPITTVAGSEKDIIKDGINGLFVAIDSPIDLSEKIVLLMDDYNYDKMRKAILNDRNQYILDYAVSRFNDVLKHVMKEYGRD